MCKEFARAKAFFVSFIKKVESPDLTIKLRDLLNIYSSEKSTINDNIRHYSEKKQYYGELER